MSFNGDLDKFVVDLETRLRKYKREFGMEAKRRMEDITPVRTGLMKKGWGFTEKQESIEIWNTAPYSAYVNNGTETQRPQRIVEQVLLQSNEISEIAKAKAGIK